MASFLDISLLERGSGLFVFLLVLILIYAILSATDFFKMSKFSSAVIAFCVAILTLFMPPIVGAIRSMIPFFVLGIAFIMFLLLLLSAVGMTGKDLSSALSSRETGLQIKWWIIIVAIIIFVSSIASQFTLFSGADEAVPTSNTNQQPVSNDPSADSNDRLSVNPEAVGDKGSDALVATLFHPKMLGLIAIMLIAVFASIFMASSNKS